MISWRRERQIIILLFTSIFIVALSAVIFIARKPLPGCFDDKQNQGEAGVDCGGPCAAVCREEIISLSVEWVRFFPVSDGYYDVIAKINNPNNRLGVPSLSYSFEIFDANNISINKREGATFVNANETFYVFESNLLAGERVPRRATFRLGSDLEWKRDLSEKPKLSILNKKFLNEPTPLLTATVSNESLYYLKDFKITAVLYDAEGNAYGASGTLVESLTKDLRAEISFTWPKVFPQLPTNIDIAVRVNDFLHPELEQK